MSIPAPFRTLLRTPSGEAPLVLRPSHRHACVEGWSADAFARDASLIDRLPRFSEEEEDLALAMFSDATDVEPDKEGRIVLPKALADHAAIVEEAVFIGVGTHFQIWEPTAGARRVAEARERARVLKMTLPAPQPAAPPGANGS